MEVIGVRNISRLQKRLRTVLPHLVVFIWQISFLAGVFQSAANTTPLLQGRKAGCRRLQSCRRGDTPAGIPALPDPALRPAAAGNPLPVAAFPPAGADQARQVVDGTGIGMASGPGCPPALACGPARRPEWLRSAPQCHSLDTIARRRRICSPAIVRSPSIWGRSQ